MLNRILATIGALTATYFLFRVSSFIYIFFIRKSSLPRYLHGSQPWALITGSSDGIGLAFAHELASSGFSIILHGRNPSKLERVRDDLLKSYPSISVRIFVLDAGESASIGDTHLPDIVAGCHLTILVNNVAQTGPVTDAKEIDKQINVNVRFTAQLTAYLLPLLKSNGPSLILNVSSSAELGSPWLSVYSGSKAFVSSWSKGLAAEMKAEDCGVEVMVFKVSEVNTTGNPTRESLMVLGARSSARMALDRVGCGIRSVSPYWLAAIQRGVGEALPDWIVEKMLIRIVTERRKRSKGNTPKKEL